VTNYTPQSGLRLTSPQQVSGSFQVLSFQGNLDKPLGKLATQISQFPSEGIQIDNH